MILDVCQAFRRFFEILYSINFCLDIIEEGIIFHFFIIINIDNGNVHFYIHSFNELTE